MASQNAGGPTPPRALAAQTAESHHGAHRASFAALAFGALGRTQDSRRHKWCIRGLKSDGTPVAAGLFYNNQSHQHFQAARWL